MKPQLFTLLVLCLCIPSCADREAELTKDKGRLQGVWQAEFVVFDSEGVLEREDAQTYTFTFDRDTLNIQGSIASINVTHDKHCTYSLDPVKDPKQINFSWRTGTASWGIYAFEGDKLKICWGNKKGRPKSLPDNHPSGYSFFILKRSENPSIEPGKK